MNPSPSDYQFDHALGQFVLLFEKMPLEMDNAEIRSHIGNICRMLRIAHFETSLRTPVTIKHHVVFFSEGISDDAAAITYQKETPDGNFANYVVKPHQDAEPWSEAEMEQIHQFLSTLFIVNGRARVMKIANHLSFYDMELDIPNLRFFEKKLNMLFEQGNITEFGACRFNLKRFTVVNSRLGRMRGNQVMKQYAMGLRNLVGQDGTVCRIGGDNFVTIFRRECYTDVQRYLMGTPIETNYPDLPVVTISAHAGYYMITPSSKTFTDVMDRISFVAKVAKSNTLLPYIVYDDQMRKIREEHNTVESKFLDAIRNEEFHVMYQPKVDLSRKSLSGAEALCRWHHNGEVIMPGHFIPVLEMSNNICILDFYMLEHICQDIRNWLDAGLPMVRISVNFSRIHLGDENLSQQITDIIDRYQVPHDYIEIELTETTTDVDFKELKRIVHDLHSAGISTSVDDFGVGYSSLNLIRDLPWNVLKIDKSFLPDPADGNKASKKVMLKHVISMARELGLESIVEGVETEEQIAILLENNCFQAQGFYFDRPLTHAEFEQKLMEMAEHNFSYPMPV